MIKILQTLFLISFFKKCGNILCNYIKRKLRNGEKRNVIRLRNFTNLFVKQVLFLTECFMLKITNLEQKSFDISQHNKKI